MPLRVGSTSVVLKLGSQSVTGRLGATLVTATVPGAPTISSAYYDPSDGGTNVQWSAPASNGGSVVTGYVVYIDGDPQSPTTAVSNTHYQFATNFSGAVAEVAAVNAVGEGPQSAPVTVVVA